MINISKHGRWKIKHIIALWLKQTPGRELLANFQIKYLIFDGTYFKHENCLMAVMSNHDGKIVNHQYCFRENYEAAYAVFNELKVLGVLPKAITIDGNTSIIRALKAVWPNIIIQRCLAHIQRQGLSWLRRNPKLQASKNLREILLTITGVKTERDKQQLLLAFEVWERKYGKFVCQLSHNHKVFSDLQRTRSLMLHALPDMFHYLTDIKIAATTNRMEGYFSRLKMIYRQHRGLSKSNRQNYFNWYIYFKNNN